MLLAVDIGNTNVKLGAFQGSALLATWRVATVFGVAPLVVGENVDVGLRVLYEPPSDVGADRLVASAAAYRRLGGPVIVVEFGTATVFDAVSGTGEYLGGAIHPGLQLAAEVLFTGTSQLRRIELRRPAGAIGRTTSAAIQSGVVLGHVGMVEGMIARFRRDHRSGSCRPCQAGAQRARPAGRQRRGGGRQRLRRRHQPPGPHRPRGARGGAPDAPQVRRRLAALGSPAESAGAREEPRAAGDQPQ
jgi:pantothenate kinase type III